MIAATLGWVGTVGTILAYLSVSRGWLGGNSRRYATLNIVGGTMAGVAAGMYGAWPSAASNFIWALIGVLTVLSRVRPGRAPRACREPASTVAPSYSIRRAIDVPPRHASGGSQIGLTRETPAPGRSRVQPEPCSVASTP